MIAIDTNILVYARRAEAPHHVAAKALLTGLAEGTRPWALFWPCVYEFLRVVTHPRVFDPPTALGDAVDDIASLLASPSVVSVGEGPSHLSHLERMLDDDGLCGNLVHDAHIAALAVEHGVSEFLTADRDFTRFTKVRCRNPFARPGAAKR